MSRRMRTYGAKSGTPTNGLMVHSPKAQVDHPERTELSLARAHAVDAIPASHTRTTRPNLRGMPS